MMTKIKCYIKGFKSQLHCNSWYYRESQSYAIDATSIAFALQSRKHQKPWCHGPNCGCRPSQHALRAGLSNVYIYI